MTLIEYLRKLNRLVPPTASFAGVLTEGAGPPDGNCSPFYMFFVDSTTGDIYFNGDRDGAVDQWKPGLVGTYLTDGESRLKVTV